jgi:hypothetical protein
VHNVGGARDVFDAPGARLLRRPPTGGGTRLMDALEFVTTITLAVHARRPAR